MVSTMNEYLERALNEGKKKPVYHHTGDDKLVSLRQRGNFPQQKVKIVSWKGTTYDDEYEKGDEGLLKITSNGFEFTPTTGMGSSSYSDKINITVDNVLTKGKKITAKKPKHNFVFQIM